jgi:hypothetical protein
MFLKFFSDLWSIDGEGMTPNSCFTSSLCIFSCFGIAGTEGRLAETTFLSTDSLSFEAECGTGLSSLSGRIYAFGINPPDLMITCGFTMFFCD